jgi:hypothetical protein
MISRTLSTIIAITYLILAYLGGGGYSVLPIALFLVLPLACIWFSEEMGAFTGVMRGQTITTKTPGCLVAFGGWLILLIPFVMAAVRHFAGK